MKILFTGGGTGGHIFPIIAVAREIRKIQEEKKLRLFYLGPEDEFASILLSQEDIKIKKISAGKLRRYLSLKSIFQNIIDLFIKIPVGILQSYKYIFFTAPDLIFSKGGFGSIPGVIAGKLLGTPIFLHESDLAPGLSNRFLGGFAQVIFVSFPKTEHFKLSKMIQIGNPIRKEIFEVSKKEVKEIIKLVGGKPVILILGGSQGAQRINDKILEILPDLLKNFEVIHQVGQKNLQGVIAESKTVITEDLEKYYHVFPFFKEHELKQAYGAADLIVARAGSGTIFEIAALGTPSILIPLPEAAQDHQVKNAYAYAQTGACQVLEETNFTPRFFLEKLKNLFSNPPELEKMSEAARKFAKPMAAKEIAQFIVDYLKR